MTKLTTLLTKFLPVSFALVAISTAHLATLPNAKPNQYANFSGKVLTKLITFVTNSPAFVAPVFIKFKKNEPTFVKTLPNNVPICGNNLPKPVIMADIICGKALANSTIIVGIALTKAINN